MDGTVGDKLYVDIFAFPSLQGRRWQVHVWHEDRDQWEVVSRYEILANIAHRTVTVLAREMASRLCPTLGREVELLQLRRGVEHIVSWEAVDLRVSLPTTVGEDFTIVSWDTVSIAAH